MSSSENKPQKQTYWFYKWPLWLRIVLCIFLSPIFIPIVIWPIIRIPLWIKITLLTFYIVIVSFYLMFSSFSNLPKSNNKREEIPMEVSGIVENEIKKDDKVSLKIKTSPTLVDKITINDEEIKQGFFSNEYKFEKVFPEGDNKIRIFAKKDSKVTEKEINFKVDLSERKAAEEAKKLEQAKKDEEQRIQKQNQIPYEIIKEVKMQKNIKTFYVLVKPLELNQSFKDNIKNIITGLAREKGVNNNFEIFDNAEALEIAFARDGTVDENESCATLLDKKTINGVLVSCSPSESQKNILARHSLASFSNVQNVKELNLDFFVYKDQIDQPLAEIQGYTGVETYIPKV
jgi:hypothetical protein